MSEGVSTGNGGGFTQSGNPFGGLNNTDLRGRRKRRTIPLLNTSWLIRPRNTKERGNMHKALTDMIGTLRTSVIEIAQSGATDSEQRLTKSFGEFEASLGENLLARYGADPEPLAKGLNHIASFASALNRIYNVVEAIKTGRPSYMLDSSDSSQPAEELPGEIKDDLDHFIDVGVLTLRTMVNNSVELPTEAELARAERVDGLYKIEGVGGDILIKSLLPPDLVGYAVDPLDLLMEWADLSKRYEQRSLGMAEAMLSNGMEIPEEIVEAYPQIFTIDDPRAIVALGKAFPPKKKPSGGGNDDTTDDPQGDSAGGGQRQQSQGGNPDPDDDGDGADLTDDVPADPMQMIARLATMITVIASGISQGMGGDDDGSMPNTVDGNPDDPRNVGLQRIEPPSINQPLSKIFVGAVDGTQTLADVIRERDELRNTNTTLAGEVAGLKKRDQETAGTLAQLQEAVARLGKMPVPPVGVVRALPAVTKAQDNAVRGGGAPMSQATMTKGIVPSAELAEEIDELQKRDATGEGDAAAARMIREVHLVNGSPMLPSVPLPP